VEWNMRVVVLPGDGIGPEITRATLEVLLLLNKTLSLGLNFETHEIGLASLRQFGTTLPNEALEAARDADGILLGPISSFDYPPRPEGGVNVSSELRILLDLYANIRPCRSRQGLPFWGRTKMDIVIPRENTEGFYSDRNMTYNVGEFMPSVDMALSLRKITAHASQRIGRVAFDLARKRSRKVTAVHKANVLKVSDGLFLRELRKICLEYPDVTYEEQLVDSMAALLVRDAIRFDVLVTTNMFGDILSDEAAELSGSLGLGAALNQGDRHAMAQAAHGSAPDIAGHDVANPTSLILSAAMLLEWLASKCVRNNLLLASRMIVEATDKILNDPERRTKDLGGRAGTRAFTEAICREIVVLMGEQATST
jgi:isocitrate/isopropylmalate dehydrogenase